MEMQISSRMQAAGCRDVGANDMLSCPGLPGRWVLSAVRRGVYYTTLHYTPIQHMRGENSSECEIFKTPAHYTIQKARLPSVCSKRRVPACNYCGSVPFSANGTVRLLALTRPPGDIAAGNIVRLSVCPSVCLSSTTQHNTIRYGMIRYGTDKRAAVPDAFHPPLRQTHTPRPDRQTQYFLVCLLH